MLVLQSVGAEGDPFVSQPVARCTLFKNATTSATQARVLVRSKAWVLSPPTPARGAPRPSVLCASRCDPQRTGTSSSANSCATCPPRVAAVAQVSVRAAVPVDPSSSGHDTATRVQATRVSARTLPGRSVHCRREFLCRPVDRAVARSDMSGERNAGARARGTAPLRAAAREWMPQRAAANAPDAAIPERPAPDECRQEARCGLTVLVAPTKTRP